MNDFTWNLYDFTIKPVLTRYRDSFSRQESSRYVSRIKLIRFPRCWVSCQKKKNLERLLPWHANRGVNVNVLPESDRRCPLTSASDCPDSRQEKDDAAARTVPSPESPDPCPPRKGQHVNARTTEEEVEAVEEASAADRTRDSADDPQGRRPNPRTTPQLLATKVPSPVARMYTEFFTADPDPDQIRRPIPRDCEIFRVPLACRREFV